MEEPEGPEVHDVYVFAFVRKCFFEALNIEPVELSNFFDQLHPSIVTVFAFLR
jgi:hypothetical protein